MLCVPSFAIGLLAILMQGFAPRFYEQGIDFIDSFFVWVLLAQFVHLSWTHLTLNLLGLATVIWGFERVLQTREVLLVQALSFPWVAFYIICLEPLSWYCGLSGALHFQFTVFLGLACWRNRQAHRNKWPLLLLVLGLVGKLVWEATSGGSFDSLVGGPVAIEAHRGGVLGGVVFLVCYWPILRRHQAG